MTSLTTTGDHQRRVCATFAGADPRTAEVLQAAVRHLCAFVEEIGLSPEEWRTGIEFLTAVGQKCDDERQEFILLSDTLGISMLVEMVNDQTEAGATEPTVLGPFYVPGAPARSFGESIVDDPATGGEPLVVSGAVRDLDGRPVPGATLDVWEVQPNGRYDIEEDGHKRNLRGVFTTADDGRYEIRTVRPVDYPVPEDGPVGDMLRVTGRSPWRPAHVHLMVRAPGFRPLVTHVFDRRSPWLDNDAVFGVRESIVASMDNGSCTFDIILGRL
jgi:catechol 1,2-dioxygenase